jgi:hypothetical protein
MDHAVGFGCATAETIEILHIAAMHLRSHLGERLGPLIGARQPQHLMSGRGQLTNYSRPDKSGRTGHKNTHQKSSRMSEDNSQRI